MTQSTIKTHNAFIIIQLIFYYSLIMYIIYTRANHLFECSNCCNLEAVVAAVEVLVVAAVCIGSYCCVSSPSSVVLDSSRSSRS